MLLKIAFHYFDILFLKEFYPEELKTSSSLFQAHCSSQFPLKVDIGSLQLL